MEGWGAGDGEGAGQFQWLNEEKNVVLLKWNERKGKEKNKENIN